MESWLLLHTIWHISLKYVCLDSIWNWDWQLYTSSPIWSRIFIAKYLENLHKWMFSLTAGKNSCKLYNFSSWAMISYMHISLELSWNAQMEYFSDFSNFHIFGQLSRKVIYLILCLFFLLICITRVLLACIKYLSHYPCPRCLVWKNEISALGMELNQHQCETQKQTDTQMRRRKVERVRKWVYESGMTITSVLIKQLLGPQSLTPTQVWSAIFIFP